MKIKNIKKHNKKLIQLQILKLYYKKKSYNFKTNIKQTELNLNKISNIIYNYHIHNKKILFLGFPKNFKKILQNTKHTLVTEYEWINGMLSNRHSRTAMNNVFSKEQTKTSTYNNQLTLKLQKKIDLIIIYNLNEKATAVEESYIAKIPVITFNENFKINDNQAIYESPDNFKLINDKIFNNNFFFSIIKTTLKKALKTKKIFVYKNKKSLSNFYTNKTYWNGEIIMKKRKFFSKKKPKKYYVSNYKKKN